MVSANDAKINWRYWLSGLNINNDTWCRSSCILCLLVRRRREFMTSLMPLLSSSWQGKCTWLMKETHLNGVNCNITKGTFWTQHTKSTNWLLNLTCCHAAHSDVTTKPDSPLTLEDWAFRPTALQLEQAYVTVGTCPSTVMMIISIYWLID